MCQSRFFFVFILIKWFYGKTFFIINRYLMHTVYLSPPMSSSYFEVMVSIWASRTDSKGVKVVVCCCIALSEANAERDLSTCVQCFIYLCQASVFWSWIKVVLDCTKEVRASMEMKRKWIMIPQRPSLGNGAWKQQEQSKETETESCHFNLPPEDFEEC